MVRTPILSVLLVFLSLLVAGCGPVKGYPGPDRPSTQLANIQPNPFWSGIGVVVTGVDGLEVQAEMSLDVLAGRRTLGLQLQPYSRTERSQASGGELQSQAIYDVEWQTTVDWTVELAAGMDYALAGSWNESVYEVQLQDAKTRTVIATRAVTATRRDL